MTGPADSVGPEPDAGERIFTWPDRDAPGRYLIGCSCGRWTFEGSAEEIYLASVRHDDSPWRNHIVGIRRRLDVG